MSKELADKIEGDLSASTGTTERARRARKQGAALDMDWETAFEVYYAQANQDPKKFVRFPDTEPAFPESIVVNDIVSGPSNDDERFESAAQK